MELEGGTAVQLACSWRLQAGTDAIITAAFYGTEGGAALRNVGGSFTISPPSAIAAPPPSRSPARRTNGAAAPPPTGQPAWPRSSLRS
jgi:hypothetical protein